MFTTMLAGLAVIIALQALRMASRDRIIIQVMPESALPVRQSLELPPFLNKPRASDQVSERELASESQVRAEQPASFQQSSPRDIHLN